MLPPLAALSSPSWPVMWMFLEINMFSYLMLLLIHPSMMSSETAVKYFIAQAPSSSILLLSALALTYTKSYLPALALVMAIMFKMGMAPFHQWFLSMAKGLKMIPFALLLTWQKIIPLTLTFLYNMPLKMMTTLIILNGVIGAVGGVGQTLIRPLLCFSSINHTAWIIIAMKSSTLLFVTYTIIYFLMIFSLLAPMTSNLPLNHWIEPSNNSSVKKIPMLTTNLLSLAGMPPLIGFGIKWMVLHSVTLDSFIIVIVLMTSMITLLYYIKISLVVTMKTLSVPHSIWDKKSMTLMLINYTGPSALLLMM